MAWTRIGNLNQLESLEGVYPPTQFEYGVKYNHGCGAIHPVVVTSWNRGIRVTAVPEYPQGDALGAMTFGTTVFAKGLDDCNDGQWHHQYYQGGKLGGGSNGTRNPDLYARRLACSWTGVGTLNQLEDFVTGDYPLTHFEYGVRYNTASGSIHPIVINGWNRGIRVSVAPTYPQGDMSTGMTFGTAVFGKGLDDCNDGQWHHQYYQGGKRGGGSNGIANPDLFVRRFPGVELEEKQQQNATLERDHARLRAQVEELQAERARKDGIIQGLQSQHAAYQQEVQRQRAFYDATFGASSL